MFLDSTCVHIYAYVYGCVCFCVCISYENTYTYVHICTFVFCCCRLYVYTYIYIHIYICMFVCSFRLQIMCTLVYIFTNGRVRANDLQIPPSSIPQSCCVIVREIVLSSYSCSACAEPWFWNRCPLRIVLAFGHFEMKYVFRNAPLNKW